MMNVGALIRAVQERPAIWDRQERDHANRVLVNSAWTDISKELNYDETALRKKWKYLREYFAVEYNKLRGSSAKSGYDADKHPVRSKWQFFKKLLFLKDIVVDRRPPSDTPKEDIAFDDDMSSCESFHVSTTETAFGREEPETKKEICSPSEEDEAEEEEEEDFKNVESFEPVPARKSLSGPLTSKPSQRPSFHKSNETRKRKRDTFDDYREEINERSLPYYHGEKRQTIDESNDEDFLFLKSLLPYMKMVPQHLKLSVRSRIQTVLDETVFPPASVSHTSSDI